MYRLPTLSYGGIALGLLGLTCNLGGSLLVRLKGDVTGLGGNLHQLRYGIHQLIQGTGG